MPVADPASLGALLRAQRLARRLPQGAPPVKAPGDLNADYTPLTETQLAQTVRAAASGRAPNVRLHDVLGSRLRYLNATMGWAIPAEADAPVHRGGGWLLS